MYLVSAKPARLALAIVSAGLFLASSGSALASDRASLQSRPLTFEENQGQTTANVKFISRGKSGVLLLGSKEITLQAPDSSARFRLKLMGSSADTSLVGSGESSGTVNYISGNDSSKWLTNIPSFTRVTYKNVYANIDLIVYENNGQFESDFMVAKGADPSVIDLRIDGNVEASEDGAVTIKSSGGAFELHRPLVYQVAANGERAIVDCHYTINGGQVGFALGKYDHSKSLVIDPVLTYSTYLGGSGGDLILGMSGDLLGNIYVTGQTTSLNFPTANPVQGKNLSTTGTCFVSKFDPTGKHLLYSTYLGGSGTDKCASIAVNLLGEAFVGGTTSSTNFPVKNALQGTLQGGAGTTNGFVTHLNAAGSQLIFSTYLGGGGEFLTGLAVDLLSNVYAVGTTASIGFPSTKGAFQTACASTCVEDGFLTKINSTGKLVYSTYLGGSGYDSINGVAVDTAGSAYVTGQTTSVDFPTKAAYQPTFGSGSSGTAFVAKFSVDGSSLAYSTYLGGTVFEIARAIDVDLFGNAYVTGGTASPNFPVFNAYQPTFKSVGTPATFGTVSNIFVTKLNAAGSALVYSTFLGGTGYDSAFAIDVDLLGNAAVAGETFSVDYPTKNAIQASNGGGYRDAVVTNFSSTGKLNYSTYLGGSGDDYALAVYFTPCGSLWVGGMTNSTNFPVLNAYQATNGGGSIDGFLTDLGIN